MYLIEFILYGPDKIDSIIVFNLLEDCESHLKSIGFVKANKWVDEMNEEKAIPCEYIYEMNSDPYYVARIYKFSIAQELDMSVWEKNYNDMDASSIKSMKNN